MRYIILLAIFVLLLSSCKKEQQSEGSNRPYCDTKCHEAGISARYLYYYDSSLLDTVIFNTYNEGDSFKPGSLVKSEVLYEEKMEQSKVWMHKGYDYEIIVNSIDTFRISKIINTPTIERIICNYGVCFYYTNSIEVNGQPGEVRPNGLGSSWVTLKNPH